MNINLLLHKKRWWVVSLGILLLVCYVAITVSVANHEKEKVVCHDVAVEIIDSAKAKFVTSDGVKSILRQHKLHYFAKSMADINVDTIRKILVSKSLIKNAEVSMNADGILLIKIEQRIPIIRIISNNGYDFYIDRTGYVFQWYKGYTANVLTATGNCQVFLPSLYKGKLSDIPTPNTREGKLVENLYLLAKVLEEDSYWSSYFTQIYIKSPTAVELVPRLGSHTVILGDLSQCKYKLHKLRTFYEKTINTKGWNYYKTINIGFSNQIIGTK